jgi:uncharacterized DUF497 family protein
VIEFDNDKDRSNRRKHGLPLAAAERIDWTRVVEEIDDRRDYRELRIVALGILAGRIVVCTYTWRGDVRRIISLRRATRSESHEYYQAYR